MYVYTVAKLGFQRSEAQKILSPESGSDSDSSFSLVFGQTSGGLRLAM